MKIVKIILDRREELRKMELEETQRVRAHIASSLDTWKYFHPSSILLSLLMLMLCVVSERGIPVRLSLVLNCHASLGEALLVQKGGTAVFSAQNVTSLVALRYILRHLLYTINYQAVEEVLY